MIIGAFDCNLKIFSFTRVRWITIVCTLDSQAILKRLTSLKSRVLNLIDSITKQVSIGFKLVNRASCCCVIENIFAINSIPKWYRNFNLSKIDWNIC